MVPKKKCKFAQTATGDVTVIHSVNGVRTNSIWAKIKYPILNNKNNINYITIC